MDIANIRKDYTLRSLEADEVADSPLAQFNRWFEEAIKAEVNEPNAMNLATINAQNRPSSRIVLLKGLDNGFIFYTNYNSKKGKELQERPFAALNFFWPELERQVRIEGEVEKVSEADSDQYFYSRPVSSQIGAWASPQSQIIPDRSFLEDREKEMTLRFQNESLRRPPHWGGFRLIPFYFEFWQGRASRLHDRVVFEKEAAGQWTKKVLAP
jgi:pyridoxamine 5'-phosphate oxidase